MWMDFHVGLVSACLLTLANIYCTAPTINGVDTNKKCLTSPGYPNKYPDNSHTKHTLSVDGQAMEITWSHFDLEEHHTCSYDYIEFFDGNGNAVFKKFCGNTSPPTLTISTSTASVVFHSDKSVRKNGFKFCYEPGVPVQYLSSPNYPRNYPDNQDTSQTISVESGAAIRVTFHDFQIENHYSCDHDYVQFCDGKGRCGEKMCGKTQPKDFTIQTSKATVLFHSDDSVTPRGFLLSYRAGSYETEMLIQLETSTAFETAKLSSIQKENCTEEMKVTMKKYKETEDIIKKLRFKKPYIRSTELTDRLGSDSRLFTALKQTITRVSREWTSIEAGERLIQFMSENFQKWAKKGGGLSILETRPGSEESGDGDLVCSDLLQYRRIDGKCNNLAVTDQGSAGIAMRRFMPNKYEDGVSIPRGGLTNSLLPSARVVSRKIHHASNPNPLTDKGYTLMAMQFGQFLDHDITLTADMEMECCDPEILSNYPSVCFNIDITGDDFYSGKTTCHSFTRSEEIVSDTGVREQINGITAYIDASNVYGSDDDLAKNLRTLVNGRLKTHADGPTLPTRRQANRESKGPAQLDEDLVAGDMRAIEQPTLASIHSLFLNEHNRIADELRSRLSDFLSNKNQSEQDEIIYQESRKLVGAEMQNIVYNEFLPIVLGREKLTKHNLQLSAVTTYDDQIDPSIRNEFATVAFRFGHSLIAGMFNGNGGHRLKLTYFDESPEFVSGRSPNNNGRAWYSELTETSKQTSPADDVFCTEDVTNFLFSNTRGGATNFGDDLPARNIQRGRDHGLPPYNEFRTFCGLNPLEDFHNKPDEITAENWAKLKNTYNRVNDIDAWTGGLAETAPRDGLVGPTFACIIGKQFNVLKFGGRFFFNNDNGNGLKIKSRKTIAKRNLGDIICDNTDTTTLQRYVMIEEDASSNPQQKCSSRNTLDFDAIAMDITDEGLFSAPVNACIRGFNNAAITGVTLEECKEKCYSATSFICKSLDHIGSLSECYLSEETKTTQPSAYTEPCTYRRDSIYLEQKFSGLFSEPVNACIRGFNNAAITGVTLEECKEKCYSATSFICKSLDHIGSFSACYLSEETKTTQPSAYTEPCTYRRDSIYLERKFSGCPTGCSCQTSTEKMTFVVGGDPGDKFDFEFRTLTQIGGEETYKNTAFFLKGGEDKPWSEFVYARGSKSGSVTLEDDHTGLHVYVYPYSATGCEERNACRWYDGAWDFKVCKL